MGAGTLSDDLTSCGDSVGNLHAYVHEHHIGRQLLNQSLDVYAVIGFSNNLDIAFLFKQATHTLSNELMIVCQYNCDHRAHLALQFLIPLPGFALFERGASREPHCTERADSVGRWADYGHVTIKRCVQRGS